MGGPFYKRIQRIEELKKRKDLERKLGESVISPLNAKELGKRDDKEIEEE